MPTRLKILAAACFSNAATALMDFTTSGGATSVKSLENIWKRSQENRSTTDPGAEANIVLSKESSKRCDMVHS